MFWAIIDFFLSFFCKNREKAHESIWGMFMQGLKMNEGDDIYEKKDFILKYKVIKEI